MRSYISKLIIFSSFPVLLMIIVNYKYDPANLFDSGNLYERTIADHLLKGYNVTNVSNMDERKLQQFFIEGLSEPPEIIVLGSSNSLYIDSDFFSGKRVINNAVSAASFNDFIAIYDLYEKKGFKPNKVILGICPEMLNFNQSNFYTSIEDNYRSMLYKIGLKPEKTSIITRQNKLNKWKEIVSLSYFKQSVKMVLNKNTIQPTKVVNNKNATRLIDGSLNNGEFYTKKTRENIDNSIKRLIGKPAPELENFDTLNSDCTEILEHFVKYLQNNNVEVVFYFMIYHPEYYDYVSKKYPILGTVENYLETYAREKGIRVYGQNDPKKCNVTNSDFTDYCHLFKSGLLKIFSTGGTL